LKRKGCRKKEETRDFSAINPYKTDMIRDKEEDIRGYHMRRRKKEQKKYKKSGRGGRGRSLRTRR
jgi:hypothetical protein